MQAAHLRTDGRQPVQICSAQTLARRKRPEADLVIVDEAHEMHASVLRWIAECPGVPFIGLSATPWARGLGKHYDDLIIPTTTRELIDRATCPTSSPTRRQTPTCRASRPTGRLRAGRAGRRDGHGRDHRRHRQDVAGARREPADNRFLRQPAARAKRLRALPEAGVAAEYIDGETPSGDDSYDPDPKAKPVATCSPGSGLARRRSLSASAS